MNASELLENLEEIFPRYYMHSDIFKLVMFLNFQPHNGVLPGAKSLSKFDFSVKTTIQPIYPLN